ncbi:MAG: hypothetical protein ACXWXS_00155 [Actinomycetota bacterium]
MTPMGYVRAVRRRWKTVVACVLISLPIGWVFSLAQPASSAPVRSFTAIAYLEPASISSPLYTDEDALGGVATRATLGDVPVRAHEKLHYRGTLNELLEQIEVAPVAGADLLSITATSTDEERALRMANVYAEELIAYQQEAFQAELDDIAAELEPLQDEVEHLRTLNEEQARPGRTERIEDLDAEIAPLVERQESLQGGVNNQLATFQDAIAQPAIEGGALSLPSSRGTRMLIVALLGLVAGIALAVTRERIDPRIQDREQAENVFDLPVLAEIPRTTRKHRRSVVVVSAPGAPASNAYQLLAAGLLFGRHRTTTKPAAPSRRKRTGEKLLVTNAVGNEGRSSTVANLAAALAGVGKRVIVISTVFDDPGLRTLLGVDQEPGLSAAVDGANGLTFGDVVRETGVPGVRLVPSGRPRDAAAGHSLFSSAGMDAILTAAAAAADIVLIDAAPVLANSDWTLLIPKVDGVLIVARAGSTTWAAAERTAELLRMLQAPCVGVALNALPVSSVSRASFRRPGTEPETEEGSSPDPSSAAPTEPSEPLDVAPRTNGNGAGSRDAKQPRGGTPQPSTDPV